MPAYHFVADRTGSERPICELNLLDQHSRERLSIDMARKPNSADVLERLSEPFARTVHLHYTGPKLVARQV